jgi:molybdopterin-guanine dinucleotide biosynthesis protein A
MLSLNNRHRITGMVLSGGSSYRMGQNKAFIDVGGVPIITRILLLFNELFKETIIITNNPEPYQHLDAGLHLDLEPGLGALGGLYTGLFYASFKYVFCVACDMPFLRGPLVQFLVNQIGGSDAVVPRTSDGLQPLHAIYSKNCLAPIRTTLDQKKSKIIDFYPLVNVRIVEEEEFLSIDPLKESFTNVNTPDELRLIHQRGHMA